MSTPEEQQIHRESLRTDTLAWLADRSLLAHHPKAIHRGLTQGGIAAYSLDEVEAALAFLASCGYVTSETPPMGATKYYRITAEGILAHERS